MIEFLAKKRKIKNYKCKSSDELLQAIKENKDNEQQLILLEVSKNVLNHPLFINLLVIFIRF